MIERLAIPAWRAPQASLDDWLAAFADAGQSPVVNTADDETWIEIAPLRLRGYVALERGHVEAINFEFPETDTLEPISSLLLTVATRLGWELHEDEPDEDDVEED